MTAAAAIYAAEKSSSEKQYDHIIRFFNKQVLSEF
jgi:hypothetical protein